jgi:hypothetical protein
MSSSSGAPMGPWDACTDITIAPPSMMATELPGVPPPAGGGAIADGTYVLTSFEVFGTAATIVPVGDVRVFAGGAYQTLGIYASAAGTFSVADTTLTLMASCRCSQQDGCSDAAKLDHYPYTADAAHVQIRVPYEGGDAIASYTKE